MKNPMERLSARSIRWLYAIFALIVLAITSVNFSDRMIFKVLGNDQCAWIPVDSLGTKLLIRDVVPNGVTAKAGILNGDLLLEIGGKPFKSSAEAQSRI
ncbi:MAG TPA: PDZ domain-containing protein, partial [Bacteroidota bacterium]